MMRDKQLSNILTKEDGRLIRKLYTLRQEGDYEDFIEVTEDDVKLYILK